MSCGRLTREVQKRLTAVSEAEAQFEPYTDWIPCTGIDAARVVLRIRALTGDFGARPAHQLATSRTNMPDVPTEFSGVSYYTANSDNYDLVVLTSITNFKFFIRFGVQYKMNDTDVGSADVTLQVSYGAKGIIRSTFSKELLGLNDSLVQREVITDWIPALEVSKFNIAYVSDADGDFQFRFAYQTSATTIEEPDSWTAMGSYVSGDAESNINDQSPTTTGKMWIRFGVVYNCTATNTNKQGHVSAAVATRG